MIRKTLALTIIWCLLLGACGDDGGGPTATACEGKDDGMACGDAQICIAEECRPSTCGDGYVDTALGEECDDANSVAGDGCESDCTFSCRTDEDCDDGSVCTGTETCIQVEQGKACAPGEPLECTSDDPCLSPICDPISGCDVAPLLLCYRDRDGDGFPDPEDSVAPVGCACPDGYMTKRVDGAWDCHDRSADVRPNQNQGFTAPVCADGRTAKVTGEIACDRVRPLKTCPLFTCSDGSKPSWDYDCDGAVTYMDVKNGATTCTSCSASGWKRWWTPPCGAEDDYLRCLRAGAGCAGLEEVNTQRCR